MEKLHEILVEDPAAPRADCSERHHNPVVNVDKVDLVALREILTRLRSCVLAEVLQGNEELRTVYTEERCATAWATLLPVGWLSFS